MNKKTNKDINKYRQTRIQNYINIEYYFINKKKNKINAIPRIKFEVRKF